MRSRRRLILVVVLVALAATSLPAPAGAQGSPAPIEQYVEQIPTAKGDRSVVGKGGTISKSSLPRSTRRKLSGFRRGERVPARQRERRNAEDQVLGLIAGSPNYGASSDTPAKRSATGGRGKTAAGNTPSGQAQRQAGEVASGRRPGATDQEGASAGGATPTAAAAPASDESGGVGKGRLAALAALLLVLAASALGVAVSRRRRA